MLTPKLNHTGLMKILPKVTKPAEAQEMRVALAKSASGKGLVLSLEQRQAIFLKKQIGKNLGWAKFPLPGGTILVQKGTGIPIVGLDGKTIPSSARVTRATVAFPEASLLTELEASERLVRHMYLDSLGNVTIGVGHLIPNETAAETLHNTGLPFALKGGSRTATSAEVKAEFQKILALQSLKSKGSKFFEVPALLRLTKADARKLLKNDMLSSLSEVIKSKKYPDFETYPAPAQQAIIDLSFNMGLGKFLAFTRFRQAVNHRDWKTAAAESSRLQVQKSRNAKTASLLLDASTLDEKKNYFFISTNKKNTKAQLSVVIKAGGNLELRVTARIP